MKLVKYSATVLLTLAVILASACSSAAPTQEPQPTATTPVAQTVVNGNGNFEVGREITLTFEIAGAIEKLNVKEGDSVTDGQVLAELGKDSLALAVNEASSGYNAAVNAKNQASIAVNQNQIAVTNAEIAKSQADIALKTAQYNLDQTVEFYTWSDIVTAEGDIKTAQEMLDEARSKLNQAPPGTESEASWQKAIYYAQQRLNAAKSRYDAMLAGSDPEQIAIKKQQVDSAQESVDGAQSSLDLARQSLTLAQASLKLTEDSVALADSSLKIARDRLSKATMTAPFAGTIAKLNVEEKSIVAPTTIIIQLVDPTSLRLNIEVDEIDIPLVAVGQSARVSVDAMPDTTFDGTVQSISVVPAEVSGLITYNVKIKVANPENRNLKIGMSASADITVSK